MTTSTATLLTTSLNNQGLVIVKVGDPERGSVPSKTEQNAIKRKMEKALRAAGRTEVVVVVPYYTQIELIPAMTGSLSVVSQPQLAPIYPQPVTVPVWPQPAPMSPWGEIICKQIGDAAIGTITGTGTGVVGGSCGGEHWPRTQSDQSDQ